MALACFPLSSFNCKPALTSEEKTTLAIWYEKWLIPFSKREDLEGPLLRLTKPIMAALRHAGYHTEREQRRTLSLILVAMHRWQRTYWVWTSVDWLDVIANFGTETRVVCAPRNATSRQILTCACLLIGPEILLSIPKLAHMQDLAGNILGRGAVQEAVTTMQQEGIRLGISANTVKEYMPAYLSEALLLCGSASLTDLTIEVFEKLKEKYSTGAKLMRRAYQPVTRILYNLSVLPYPLVRQQTKFKVQSGVDDDLHPEWLFWIDRWFATSTSARITRMSVKTLLTKAGRWFVASYPGLNSPVQWNREIAAAYVAAVCEMKIGEWAHPRSYTKQQLPKPLKPLSKSAVLSAIRVFFMDCQEWEWFPRSFDPRRSLELPGSIARLIGPDPRDIAAVHWAKLMNAGLKLTKEDIPVFEINRFNGYPTDSPTSWYPFEMVKAITIVWLFSGLRANEIQRLHVGCTRLQEPVQDDTQPGQKMTKPVCILEVPVSKTGTAFSKPVDPVIGEAIDAWLAVRPETTRQVDIKTGGLVNFLFIWRGKQFSKSYINKAIIPLLCQKSGVPEQDARGSISSHRARATIASQLYNAPNGMDTKDLQHWLGHSTPQSTINYIRPYATKLSKAYGDAEFFERNVRMIDVLVDREAIKDGTAAAGQPWLLYDLGHGLCGNPVYDTCPHRMACAKCDFYTPKASAYAQMLEAKTGIVRMKQTLTLQPEEAAALDGDEEKLDELLANLENVPTPQGPTPCELKRGF
jgi:integrase